MDRFQIKGAPTCRVVFPHGLFVKTATKGVANAEPKYNAVILIPKTDVAKCAQVQEEYARAFEDLRKKGFTGKTTKAINPKNNTLIDGDEFADEKDGREMFRGFLMLKASSKNFRPIVTDKNKLAITNGSPLPGLSVENMSDEELCDGDYVFVNVSFWTYVNSSFSGIGCNIHAVMRAAAGERIAGASGSVDDYIDTDYE